MAKFNRKTWNYNEKPKSDLNYNKRRSININTRRINSYDDIYNVNERKIMKLSCKTLNPEIYRDILNDLQVLLLKHNGTQCDMKPINPTFKDGQIEFYLNMNRTNLKIALRYYSQMTYELRCCEYSDYQVPSEFPPHWIEMIKETLVTRFIKNNEETSLNLSNFCGDKNLNEKGFILSLNNAKVMENIVNIVSPELSSLTKLVLSQNHLHNLYKLKPLLKNVNIQKLDISDNRIRTLVDLKILEGSSIEELDITQNEVSNTLKFQRLKEGIRSILPKLRTLNGKKLEEAVIIAGTSTSAAATSTTKPLPPSIKNADKTAPLFQYVIGYLTKFDMKNRDYVCDYYTSESSFTLSSFGEIPFFYKSNSSNFQLLRHSERRKLNRKIGKIQIMSALGEFPLTKHIRDSLNVDVIASTEQSMTFIFSGVFIELPPNKNGGYRPREFARWMIVTQAGLVLQDHIDIMPNDHSLYHKYKDQIMELRTAEEFISKYPELEKMFSGKIPDSEEINIIKKVKDLTKMKIEACLDLLKSSTNYDDAIIKYQQMKDNGSIPANVFE